MPSCLPPRYRLLDLLFALWGTLAFLVDLCSDVWSAVKYYQSGETVIAFLHFGLYGLSSCVLQLLSWGWFWVDGRDREAEAATAIETKTANGHTEPNGIKSAELGNNVSYTECSVDAIKMPLEDNSACYIGGDNSACHIGGDNSACHIGGDNLLTNGDTALQGSLMDDTPAHMEQESDINCKPTTGQAAEDAQYTSLSNYFYISRIWLWPSCLPLLHIFQLGYPLRCLHSLEVGIAAFRSSECSPKYRQYQEYAYSLIHDISMMRLIETFLENTPQLILVLYVIIQTESIYPFQYFSISVTFICISWAILDYHQSLRLFLKDKEKLNWLSSMVYFFWNFCLISSRIVCITLFTLTFHWMIALHFFGVWLAFFIWVCLQKTDFMQSRLLEPFYRATVAVILYFSWFNIADGKTIYRCIFYHTFITVDSGILLWAWLYLRFPSILDNYVSLIIMAAVLLTGVGLVIRVFYYKCLHPNVISETKEQYDETDSMLNTYRVFAPTQNTWKQNKRMANLSRQIY